MGLPPSTNARTDARTDARTNAILDGQSQDQGTIGPIPVIEYVCLP